MSFKAIVLKDQYSAIGKPKKCYALKGDKIEIVSEGNPCIAFKIGERMGFPIDSKDFRKING